MAFGKLAGGVREAGKVLGIMGLAATPLAAEERNPLVLAAMDEASGKITDCVGFVREQRELAADVGVSMSRSEQVSLLHECNNGELEARIEEQRQILVALDAEIQQIGLRIDENARILDEQGRELARIIAINNRLVIQRVEVQNEIDASRERQEEMLREAERILQGLVG